VVDEWGKKAPYTGEIFKRMEWLPSLKQSVLKAKNSGVGEKDPILDFFHWHRVVLDEGHECLDKHYYRGFLQKKKNNNILSSHF